MAFNAHRGTAGHTIGSQIIGKESGSGPKPDSDSGQTAVGFSHIHVSPASNGFTVSHTPKSSGGGSGSGSAAEPASQEQSHVFRDAVEAHHHIGQLLGVRMASGQQKV